MKNKDNTPDDDLSLNVEIDETEKENFTSFLPEDELWHKDDHDDPRTINVENWNPTPEWVEGWLEWYKDPKNEGKKYW